MPHILLYEFLGSDQENDDGKLDDCVLFCTCVVIIIPFTLLTCMLEP